MSKFIDGQLYRTLIDYGMRNLAINCEFLNDMNVFPVPDGDTGTNMLTTVRNGFAAVDGYEADLPDTAKKFADTVVYGARGNSGVILSQFLKGFSLVFFDSGNLEADCGCFAKALQIGVEYAYGAVSHPAEGTILTVAREAAQAVSSSTYTDLTELLYDFLAQAKITLDKTPELLPVLRSAGVVDSGGAGFVCFFEGMQKYLCGEELESHKTEADKNAPVDYTSFSRSSSFDYGYCTEGLLQLLDRKEKISPDKFRKQLDSLGDSVVASFENDKVKFHVHTKAPEKVLSFAHRFGEFLSLKIENMSVQHSELNKTVVVSQNSASGKFAVVCVAPNEYLSSLFIDMGVDVVINAFDGYSPSADDFIKAFRAADNKNVIVLPNDKNLMLVASQAKALADRINIFIADTKSVADCYASLALIDFDSDKPEAVCADIAQTVKNIYDVVITRSAKDTVFDNFIIAKNDIIAMAGDRILAVGQNVNEVAKQVVHAVFAEQERDNVTFFAGSSFGEADAKELTDYIKSKNIFTETDFVQTNMNTYDLILSFE